MTAHGKTFDLIAFGRQMRLRSVEDRAPRVRDRSLVGKARIKARKAQRRAAGEQS